MADTAPLKILQLKEGSNEVDILKDNLATVSKGLRDSGAHYVSIVAVMGAYRTGKSFLLDLLMRFMRKKCALMAAALKRQEARRRAEADLETAERMENAEKMTAAKAAIVAIDQEISEAAVMPECPTWHFGDGDAPKQPPPAWMLEGDADRISEGSKKGDGQAGFAWRPGKDKCTQGIWLWSTPFVFTDKAGRKIGVLLMDTQGAWDDTMTKAQSATIFGLTALLSSKLIYNIQNRIEEVQLENMDYITTFAQTVCAELPGSGSPYGHLELLIRDWANYEDGFTEEQCLEQMKDHENDHLNPAKVPPDAVERVERLAISFKSINSFGLPHPGLKVTKPAYDGEIAQIDPDFSHLLNIFVDKFFGEDFPSPCAPLGMEITVNSFQQVVMNFAEAFRENAADMAIGLREAFVKVEMMTCREDLLRRFKDQLLRLAPDTSVVDPVYLKKEVAKLTASLKEEFEFKLRPWRLKDSEEFSATSEFAATILEQGNVRVMQNEQQVEGATMKIVASPVVGCGAYFLLVHQWIFMIAAAGGAYCHAKKWSTRNEVELYDVSVVQGMGEDIKKFSIQRWKDLQAMQVAVNRLNPNEAMDALTKASQQAGVMAAAAASSAGINFQTQGNGAAASSNGVHKA